MVVDFLDFKIRPAKAIDVEAMAAVDFAAYSSNIDALLPGAQNISGFRERSSDGALHDAKNNWHSASVALSGDDLVGVCYLKPQTWLIYGVWINPTHHGNGIGSALIKDALQRFTALNAPYVILEVHPNNPARSLYERFGFVVIEKIVRFSVELQQNMKWLIMRRDMSAEQ